MFTDMISAVYPGICHFKFYDKVFGQNRNFYEDKMIKLDQANVGWKVVHELMNLTTRTKRKKIFTLMKNKSSAFYPNKYHVIPYPVFFPFKSSPYEIET